MEHLPGRTATRSCREQRRAAVWLRHISVRPGRVGTRRWCGGDFCHGSHAHSHALLCPQPAVLRAFRGEWPQWDSTVVRTNRPKWVSQWVYTQSAQVGIAVSKWEYTQSAQVGIAVS